MLGNWRSHSDYRSFVLSRLENLDPSSVVEYLDITKKLLILNLDPLKIIIQKRYSNTGRAAVQQPEIFRIFILMLHLKIPPNKWIDKLRHNYVLRTACGLRKIEIPSIASLYNFIKRITGAEVAPKAKTFKRKPSKKYKQGEKLPLRHANITVKLKDRILVGRRFNDPLAVSINDILALIIRQSYGFGLFDKHIILAATGLASRPARPHMGRRPAGANTMASTIAPAPARSPTQVPLGDGIATTSATSMATPVIS